jgi:formylglycine-generating enzyme required for sulfatase activity
LKDYGWFSVNSGDTTHPVKNKKPNEWGFYDMSGNIQEWVWDKASNTWALRFLRGGGWYNEASSLQSAARAYYSPDSRDYGLGFRVSASL